MSNPGKIPPHSIDKHYYIIYHHRHRFHRSTVQHFRWGKVSTVLLCLVLTVEPFGWNYKPAEKHCWLIFCERKILFWLKKQAE
jgi:hypothetical protein